jgi:hypothetical protein
MLHPGQTSLQMLLHLSIEMELQLSVKFYLDGLPAEENADAIEEIAQHTSST